MHIIKRAATIIGAVVLTTTTLVSIAEAHTPSVVPSCTGLTINLVNYEGGSTNNSIAVTIANGGDGSSSGQTMFGGSYSHTFAWSQIVSHTYTVVIDANLHTGDPAKYDKTFTGTWQPCQAPTTTTIDRDPTTTVAPTTTIDREAATTVPAPTTVATTLPCQEDQPCWDCATMGNRICGPVALPVVPVVPVVSEIGTPLVVATTVPVVLPRTGSRTSNGLVLASILTIAGIALGSVRRRPA